MKNIILVSLTVFIAAISLFPQYDYDKKFELPNGLGFASQSKYSYDIKDKTEIFENWINLDYYNGIFSTGFRMEVFQPNEPDPSISRGKEYYADIAFKYLSIDLTNFDYGVKLTAGNFYELFGRGMILKSYEDRNIRVDNNLLGIKINAHYDDFYLTALSGSAANSKNLHQDILHAVDFSYLGLNNLKTGLSYAVNIAKDKSISKTSLTSLRIEPSVWDVDFYFEFGVKQNQSIKNLFLSKDEKIIGKGFYGNSNFYFEPFSISAEYKLYDNFAFTSSDQTISYNTPPALRKEYGYLLLNRHPSPLNANNEEGFLVELNYTLNDKINFLANFGLTNSLNENSYYQRVNGLKIPSQLQFKEFYFQAYTNWSDFINSTLALGYSEEASSKTKNLTPIVETKFYLDEINTFKIIFEHQHTTNTQTDEKYFSDVLSLEYLRSPGFNIVLLTEMQTKEKESGNLVRKFWSFVQFGYQISNQIDLKLLIGSRQAGNICIGGVCRFEPEFRGVEISMLTRL